MKYFAYGSNMSLIRLQQRVPSAQKIDTVSLKNHQLRFNMSGKDGSGKCDSFYTNNSDDVVVGALFEIDENEKPILDRAESLGSGYNEKTVSVINEQGKTFEALIYCAIKIDPSLKPYTWYLNHVIVGAKETKLSTDYLAIIESVVCIEDPNKERETKERAMYSSHTIQKDCA
ncbi:gamma-glutamylcyclotransferase [Colwellia sp. BRX10-9]|jgi:gamma-glutamylcyclotransferase|uniref:gamma-glutamylcyclotransferase family protein n=1 Tax=unclassified Colwellia TaxID=196834 RepID=UPI0015F6EEE8|nr:MULTISPECIES: gamma-glutamylcyclotransferase family protein [unclassified Colwellia]MBA6353670.1 gamma-glutamylcyclotransferase [Colwellia sp. BRX9-1]MBA6384886.1 gamma-glutamylcyclotransferase [Colwellia sp. BRX10-9]